MDILTLILFVVGVILAYSYHSSNETSIKAYIKERGGTFVSKKREYFDLATLFSKNRSSYKLVYYDENKALRAVLLRVSSFGSVDFINDHAVQPADKEYLAMEYEEEPVTKKGREQTAKPMVDYTYASDKGTLTIRQEFYHPNKGETVFLDGKEAPDDTYKIGFMNFIVVENSMVKDLTMF